MRRRPIGLRRHSLRTKGQAIDALASFIAEHYHKQPGHVVEFTAFYQAFQSSLSLADCVEWTPAKVKRRLSIGGIPTGAYVANIAGPDSRELADRDLELVNGVWMPRDLDAFEQEALAATHKQGYRLPRLDDDEN